MSSDASRRLDRRPRCEAYVCEDGWFEIRDDEGPFRWIATDDPVEVLR